MASTAANVFAATPNVTGAVRNAPLGTTPPTDETPKPPASVYFLVFKILKVFRNCLQKHFKKS